MSMGAKTNGWKSDEKLEIYAQIQSTSPHILTTYRGKIESLQWRNLAIKSESSDHN